jgi:ATP/maltotriose-dependent transcriptional regulator MalT/DNA-binding SARP family transcriptional activator
MTTSLAAGPGWAGVALPPHHVARPRLVNYLSGASVSVIEAPAGYGKSVLAAELSGALGIAHPWLAVAPADNDAATLAGAVRRALKVARLSDLTAVLANAGTSSWPDRLLDALADVKEPLLLVLDDVHHLAAEDCGTAVLRLASGMPPPHRMVVAARRLPAHLEPLRAILGTRHLGPGDLAFRPDEAAQLIESLRGGQPGADLAAMVEATGGWASALVLAVTLPTEPAGPGAGASADGKPIRGSAVIGAAVDGILARLSAAEREALTQLAHLPFLSPQVVDRVTGSQAMFERLVRAGVPLARTASGWWEMPSPVAAHLARQAPLDPETASAAAAAYATGGDLVLALRVLAGAGLAASAAALIEAVTPAEAEQLGWAEIRSIAEALGRAEADRHPRMLLRLSRVAETGYRMDVRRDALERALRIVADGSADPALRRELDAERARDLTWDEATRAEAGTLARAVIVTAGDGELAARARALDALGRLRSWWSGDGPHDDAEPLLTESARLARRIGQPVWAARALVPLAMGLHFALCRYERALAIIGEALALLPARSPYRATVLTFRVTVLAELGRYREAAAAVAEMRDIAAAIGEEWLYAYASWAEAEVCSLSGDREGTVQAILDARRHQAAWFDETPGVEFLAQAADFLDRVGEHEMAADHLTMARARMAGFERVVRVYEAAVLGRSGDPVQAGQVIAATLSRADLDPQERWPIMILRAYAALRGGDPAAGGLAASAFDFCRALGVADGPLRREPAAARALLPVAAASGSGAAADLLGRATRLSVSLLGGFELRRGGDAVQTPAGRPTRAVCAVAAAGGRLHAEELIEMLWPETDPGTGRNRLKNLLSRLKNAAGDVLVRDGDIVALAPGAELDTALFEAGARGALACAARGDGHRAVSLALAALARYHGDLLPADRYETWTAQPRNRLRLCYLDLLDLLATHAQATGEVDDAIRLIRRAIESEPYDERRYLRLASLLAVQGWVGSARSALRQARAALGELGIPPSAELDALERSLLAGNPAV